MKTITRIFLLSCICFLSCGKDSSTPDPTPNEKTKTVLLTQAPWKLLKVEELSNGVWVNYNFGEPEVFTFKTDGTLTITKGTNVKNSLWKFIANETKIDVDVESTEVYDITTLNETTLLLSDNTRVRATLGH